MANEPKLPLMATDGLIAVTAFRYALGRQTYMVSHVISWLRKNRNRLSPDLRATIVREIHDAADRNALGAKIDWHEWIGLAATFEPANDKKAAHG